MPEWTHCELKHKKQNKPCLLTGHKHFNFIPITLQSLPQERIKRLIEMRRLMTIAALLMLSIAGAVYLRHTLPNSVDTDDLPRGQDQVAPMANTDGPHNRTAEEPEIREAVFRYQFRVHPLEIGYKNFKAFYLAIEVGGFDDNPDDSFMGLFSTNEIPVKKSSEHARSLTTSVVIDAKSNERGLLFKANWISWISNTEVEVDGSWNVSETHAQGYIYRVVKQDGKWKVINHKACWGA